MNGLDIFTRFVFLPLILLFIASYIPQGKKDIKEMFSAAFESEEKNKKRKTVKVHTGATVTYSNSLSYSQIPNNAILSQK